MAPTTWSNQSEGGGAEPDPIAIQLAAITERLAVMESMKDDVAAHKSHATSSSNSSFKRGHNDPADDGEYSWRNNRPYCPYNQIYFPVFSDGDPRGWILKAKKYFRCYNVPEDEKVDIAVMYLEGDALDIYSWLNADEYWCSIKQTGSIQDYRQEFAKRSASVSNWPDNCLPGVFLNGLKEELKANAVESTPYELWRGTKPNLSYLRIWGCDVYVRRLMTSGKLDSKSDRCKFVGYPKETKGYEFYHPTDNKIFVARNGTFLEKEFLSAISSGRKVDLEEIREPQEEISTAVEPERQDLVSRPAQVLPRRSDRMRNPPVRYGFLVSDEVFLILYVDDILLMGNDVPALTSVKTWLSENFAMKDLGNASYALGIRIYRDRSRKLIGLCQKLKVIGYTDASFQTDRDDYKSQAGYVFCLNGGAFSWKSSKQDTTADSTTEAEYMAAAEAAKEGVWIKKFISELGVVPSINDPIPLFCDNTGAIAQAKEPRSHQKTKHIVRSYHIIREIVDRGDVEICKVGTDDNIADPLTKPLGKLKHEGHTRDDMLKILKQNLQKAQDRMKSQAGTKHRELSFEELPQDACIHPVFPVSMLKPARGQVPTSPIAPLPITKDWEFDVQPKEVLSHHRVWEAGQHVLELLISWCQRPVEEATWECYDLLRAQFPSFRLEDKSFWKKKMAKGGPEEVQQLKMLMSISNNPLSG
ncbi:unnamed protein product [Cuscuta campestris]|uniref:Uncharacterized protein n=1 Tax=Cuscuta campestris TaxID=132261 RepID=A0A484MNP1_9ASTE|nr:unnamed protein product [Cuscuta campestris]